MQLYSILGIALCVVGFIHQNAFALVEFTNVKCIVHDPGYVSFPICRLKSVNRSYKYLSLHANLLNGFPIDNVTLHVKIWKRASGWRPFLYDITFDACKFLRNRKTNKVVAFLHGFFEKYSNMNHTCPYSNSLIVDKLPVSHINNLVTNVLPVPDGQYLFDTQWMTYTVNRATFQLYVTLS